MKQTYLETNWETFHNDLCHELGTRSIHQAAKIQHENSAPKRKKTQLNKLRWNGKAWRNAHEVQGGNTWVRLAAKSAGKSEFVKEELDEIPGFVLFWAFQIAWPFPWLFPVFHDLKFSCHFRKLSKSSLFSGIFWDNLSVFYFALASTPAIIYVPHTL